jgi:hypothetical protein
MRGVSILVRASLLALFPALVYAGPDSPKHSKPIEPLLEKLKSVEPEQRLEAARELRLRTTPEVVARKDPTRSDACPLPPHGRAGRYFLSIRGLIARLCQVSGVR